MIDEPAQLLNHANKSIDGARIDGAIAAEASDAQK
jgi:hypothetical protein